MWASGAYLLQVPSDDIRVDVLAWRRSESFAQCCTRLDLHLLNSWRPAHDARQTLCVAVAPRGCQDLDMLQSNAGRRVQHGWHGCCKRSQKLLLLQVQLLLLLLLVLLLLLLLLRLCGG